MKVSNNIYNIEIVLLHFYFPHRHEKVYAQVAAAIAMLQAAVFVQSQEIMQHIEKKIQLKGAVVSSTCVMICPYE